MDKKRNPTQHRMTRRSEHNDYSQPGMYHITLRVVDGVGHPFGRVVGDANLPDGSDGAPHVELTPLGQMVQHELLHSISTHYPMVEVQDHVIMPEHLHFIIEVHAPLVSQQGRQAHLGLVIAGFKKGCNRRYWEMTGQEGGAEDGRWGKPTSTSGAGGMSSSAEGGQWGKPTSASGMTGGADDRRDGSAGSGRDACLGVYPQGDRSRLEPTTTQPYKVPSRGTTGRPVLFAAGYVDVMPLKCGQLAQQRLYIRNNPRSRLLRSMYREVLQPIRGGIDTALTMKALYGYLQRVCAPGQLTAEAAAMLEQRLLTHVGKIDCDSYGNRQLLARELLPVVCHRRDKGLFDWQKAQCLKAAQEGVVLVSARIAPGEQEIMDAALAAGFPVVVMIDNGMPEIYHPSTERIELCLKDRLLLVTPWRYQYRKADENISVVLCKTMNCVVQAICRKRDDWWKGNR